ncbi:hypothetical protein [Cellulomonas denverensis]|uniref:Lipoprotein n=1 Tax=Cellulomonas denverensis TaxID=264297 RepID=A0A7X6KWA9_9CELL|nr:hypothetical protein [Cellulomonas denverensis]NKY23328.1 hypothetical protein [Cellulomonas denverensis]GIG24383.1 hypothetical protein Cde04nite_06270 [Cellulomonas denverensis]
MKQLAFHALFAACVTVLAACTPVEPWQSNGTGIVSGDPILREATTLRGQAATDAQDTLTGVMGLVIPDDAVIETVETVDMQWAEGGYEVKDATVIRMSFPRAEAEAFGRTTPCRILAYDEWSTGFTPSTQPWVFDLIDEKPGSDAYVCREPVSGQPPGPTRNMVAVISNSDPVDVVVAIYQTPSD